MSQSAASPTDAAPEFLAVWRRRCALLFRDCGGLQGPLVALNDASGAPSVRLLSVVANSEGGSGGTGKSPPSAPRSFGRRDPSSSGTAMAAVPLGLLMSSS